MKRLLLILLFLMSLCLLTATEDNARVLNTASEYLDNLCSNTLHELQKVALSAPAQSGNWQDIKPLLTKQNSKLPGVYFYVLPDGNYYSLALDYTNLNLSDRGYFGSLFAGNQVKGFPIYSRSSGKKSIVLAAPILQDKQTVGAIGASIFLEELHTRLNTQIRFPDGYTWFVVDATGNTILDKEADFIFMNTFTQGSESLAKAMKTVVKNKSGAVNYELGGLEREAIFQKLPTLDWWMILAKLPENGNQAPQKLVLSLQQFTPQLQNSLNEIDQYMQKNLPKRQTKWKNEKAIRKELSKISQDLPQIVDAAYVDTKGILRYIAPLDYKNFENSDISQQAHIAQMLQNHKPVFSSAFLAVEGNMAVEMGYPLYNKKKEYIGHASLLLNPALLVQKLLSESHIPETYELWIMQPDGMIVYDQDKAELGKMLFSDPLYQDYETLQELGKKISANPQGLGQYVFQAAGTKDKKVKTATWGTVKLHGREWRIVLTQAEK